MFKTLNDFKRSFNTELSRPSRFDVYLFPPTGLLSSYSTYEMVYRCENAQLPGRTFATADQRTYSPIEKYPYLTTYNDLDLTFIVSGDMREKYFFDDWFEYVNPKNTNNFGIGRTNTLVLRRVETSFHMDSKIRLSTFVLAFC